MATPIADSDVLLVVDVQNDFCPSGQLPVPSGDEVVPIINRLARRFRHVAVYNEAEGRIEMHLKSLGDQLVHIGAGGPAVSLREGETIRTECSYKYSLPQFAALSESAGYSVEQVWTDPQELFSVQWLRVD